MAKQSSLVKKANSSKVTNYTRYVRSILIRTTAANTYNAAFKLNKDNPAPICNLSAVRFKIGNFNRDIASLMKALSRYRDGEEAKSNDCTVGSPNRISMP
jgi:hypothetical protein